jgi:SIT family siderophore-iron:H+ symporter-like MFS transporter
VEAATRISRLSNFSSVLSGLVLGFLIYRIRHTKPFAVGGCALFVLSYGLLYRFRGGHSTSELGGLIAAEVVLGIASMLYGNVSS